MKECVLIGDVSVMTIAMGFSSQDHCIRFASQDHCNGFVNQTIAMGLIVRAFDMSRNRVFSTNTLLW